MNDQSSQQMKYDLADLRKLQRRLTFSAKKQDQYDLETINLIAPASPTPTKYFTDLPLLHNDIAEGLLNNRPYAGAKWFNEIEKITAQLACLLFHAEHANVQPHSVSQANQAVYQGLLQNNDTVLAMKFEDGGHLTHGLHLNFSGRFFDFQFYGTDSSGHIDYDALEKQALHTKPKMIVCGASSYPRSIDFERLRQICDQVGAYLLADLSHPAGLIVADCFPQPFPACDVVTLTLDKTMFGPHGGIILCKKEFQTRIDKAVHPGVQSSIPLRRIYEMSQCLLDAGKPEFHQRIERLINNMTAFEDVFAQFPGLMVTGGTDTHILVLNTLSVFGLTGKQAETTLENLGILTNRQVVPGETQKPYIASGLRLGATWITGRGYSAKEATVIAKMIIANLQEPNNKKLQQKTRIQVKKILTKKRKLDLWKNIQG